MPRQVTTESIKVMGRFDAGLEALADPKNEPVRWLLGAALQQQAANTTSSHFLLQLLAEQPRRSALVGWNAQIHQFRKLLINPDEAPRKALLDLKCGKEDAEEKLRSFMAEVQAAIHLSSLGYEAFEVVTASSQPGPDFNAQFEGKPAKIEVKNLQEPGDIIRTVAANHWKKLGKTDPQRYNFRLALRHGHRGSLSEAAQKRLCNLLDQLPDIKTNPFEETLDGDVKIRLEKLNDPAIQRSQGEQEMLQSLSSNSNQMVIVSAVTLANLSPEISEIQSLFLKAIKPIVGALPKFFGDSYLPDVVNVIALRWEPPDIVYSPEMLAYTQEKIEKLFEEFNLQLRPVIFCDPEIPWDLLKQYK